MRVLRRPRLIDPVWLCLDRRGNQLTEDQQWAKIKLVIEVAKQVWG